MLERSTWSTVQYYTSQLRRNACEWTAFLVSRIGWNKLGSSQWRGCAVQLILVKKINKKNLKECYQNFLSFLEILGDLKVFIIWYSDSSFRDYLKTTTRKVSIKFLNCEKATYYRGEEDNQIPMFSSENETEHWSISKKPLDYDERWKINCCLCIKPVTERGN